MQLFLLIYIYKVKAADGILVKQLYLSIVKNFVYLYSGIFVSFSVRVLVNLIYVVYIYRLFFLKFEPENLKLLKQTCLT